MPPTQRFFFYQVTDEALGALAAALSVDEIYIYNPQGVIKYSTRPEYLGWMATPGHPTTS